MAAALKRLRKELVEIKKEYSELFTIVPDIIDTDLGYKINGIIFGHNEPYKNGMFYFEMFFSHDYPTKPPVFTFTDKFFNPTDKIFHPNVHSDGKVCISILHEGEDATGYENIELRWSSVRPLYSIITSIHYVLHNPNDESPANIDAALMLRTNPKEYNRKIYQIVASTHN